MESAPRILAAREAGRAGRAAAEKTQPRGRK